MYQQGMSLKAWEWGCPDCGTYYDRDISVAKNILKFAMAGKGRSLSSVGSSKNPKGRSLAVFKDGGETRFLLSDWQGQKPPLARAKLQD
jgi:transposase